MVRVKVCGLMTERDTGICVDAGVHAVGFVIDYPRLSVEPHGMGCYAISKVRRMYVHAW